MSRGSVLLEEFHDEQRCRLEKLVTTRMDQGHERCPTLRLIDETLLGPRLAFGPTTVELADGFHRLDQWTVYWKDVPLASVPEIVTYAMERPEDFSDFSLPPVPSDQTGP